jgi:hypothetical protein
VYFVTSKYLHHTTLSVPDQGYSRNVLCTLRLISTFLFKSGTSSIINKHYIEIREGVNQWGQLYKSLSVDHSWLRVWRVFGECLFCRFQKWVGATKYYITHFQFSLLFQWQSAIDSFHWLIVIDGILSSYCISAILFLVN